MIRESAQRRIVIVSQFYPPEPCAAAYRVSALARALARRGNRVTVLTAMPSFPSGQVDKRYRNRTFVEERDGAVTVRRVWIFAAPALRWVHRVLNWLSAALGMLLYFVVQRERIDVVIVSSPPITLAIPALFAAWLHRSEVISDIRDVFPDIGVHMGRWRRNGAAAWTVGKLADRLYARSSLVVAVTSSARDELLSRKVSPDKVTVAMNGADPVEVSPQRILAENGKFVVAYVGNMGNAAGLDALLDAARTLRSERQFEFVMVGGGAQEPRLRKRARQEGLENVRFLGVLPRDRAMRVLSDADACVVPLASGIRDSLPTKIFDALSVGCPVIAAAEGEAQRFIQRSGGGVCVRPEDGAALAAMIERLSSSPSLLSECAQRGRDFLRAQYDRETIMSDLAARIAPLEGLAQTKAS
ncbi:MAG: glycosyltransferase family 4 protein [Candidatus Eremiobacteraeota bacterium]|nr:glycosyltransferase family 4 protein [Candidatus Eremiobacteraeota bacterium]